MAGPSFIKFVGLEKAPEFSGISRWFNTSKPLSISGLRGKVVLIDFWTYTCVNCIRTLPHLTGWYEKYKDKGLVIVGVHTPEFEFEKKVENVERAIRQSGIRYPVALDSNYKTWNEYENHYWPAEYLIDSNGNIRKTHFGEGNYEETEEAIRLLLKEAGNTLDDITIIIEDKTPHMMLTPETYLGLARMDRFASNEEPRSGTHMFTIPEELPQHHFAYGGEWDLQPEHSSSQKYSVMELAFYANSAFLVMHPKGHEDKINVFLDGNPIEDSASGKDVKGGVLKLDVPRMYHLVDLKGKTESHKLRLEFGTEGTSIYAFTFG